METVCRDQMVARADAYRILAAFMNLPTQDFNQSLQDGSMMLSWQAIIPHLSWSEESARDAETILSEYANEEPSSLEQLRIEYTRLFSHPDHPVVFPYEAQFLFSHALDDADKEPVFVINKIALDVDEAYQNAGYQRPRGKVISSDYLGTELSFVALLCDSMADAPADEGKDVAMKYNDFLDRHLGRWTNLFYTEVEQYACLPEYKLLGRLGRLVFG